MQLICDCTAPFSSIFTILLDIHHSQYFCFFGITPLTPPFGFSTSPAYRGMRCMWQ